MRALPFLLALAACAPEAAAPPAPQPRHLFPAATRPVADIRSDRYSDEESRDAAGEAETVLRLAGVRPGLTVADIGAGAGYYTLRLAPVVGPRGMVIATDIIPDYLARLRRRMRDSGHSNVALMLGDADNPRLPPNSTHIALMVHMYHEIAEPYAFLWHLHDGLTTQPDGRPPVVAIVDSDRPTTRHGTPLALLTCEMAAAGFRRTAHHPLSGTTYLALFTPTIRPAPKSIKAC